jgi:general secretion pathway protein G
MRRVHRSGFTLVELMAVVAIIGLLATAVALSVAGQNYPARVKIAASDMSGIVNAVRLFQLDQGRLPRELAELWTGERKFLENEPLDPWGSPYVAASLTSSSVEIVSHGADGAPGGQCEDVDLSSTTLLRRDRRQ